MQETNHNQELASLIMTYPELEVRVDVYTNEICNDFNVNIGTLINPVLDEYCLYGDTIYYKSDDIDKMEEDIKENIYFDISETTILEHKTEYEKDQIIHRMYEQYMEDIQWIKCINVKLDLR